MKTPLFYCEFLTHFLIQRCVSFKTLFFGFYEVKPPVFTKGVYLSRRDRKDERCVCVCMFREVCLL